jgi:hypothetical protein
LIRDDGRRFNILFAAEGIVENCPLVMSVHGVQTANTLPAVCKSIITRWDFLSNKIIERFAAPLRRRYPASGIDFSYCVTSGSKTE